MLMRRYLIFFTCVLLVAGCDELEYNPNQKFDGNTPQNINALNIERLFQTAGDDTVRFILSGDTQRGYSEAKDFVKRANALKGIDFVVIAGDISDFGLLQEMKWVVEIYNGLKTPYLGVIGNHDLTANGRDVFKKVFGELNYSFVYGKVKFICINTNSREVNFDGSVPDIRWLNEEVKAQNGVDNIVAISHVAPHSADFDKALEQPFVSALATNGNCLASLHAHDHVHSVGTPYENGIPFIVTGALIKKEFTIITIVNGRLESEFVQY